MHRKALLSWQCFTEDPNGREHREMLVLEIRSAIKSDFAEIGKTNSEPMEMQKYSLEKKRGMIVVPALGILSEGPRTKGNMLYSLML